MAFELECCRKLPHWHMWGTTAVTFYNRERMRNPPAGVYVMEMAFESLTGNVRVTTDKSTTTMLFLCAFQSVPKKKGILLHVCMTNGSINRCCHIEVGHPTQNQ